jgi:cytochrome c-type biogenesis protein CcmF
VYFSVERLPSEPGGPAVIGVRTFPLANWLWAGGGIMAVGTVLSAFPGKRRRRPIDPVSAPISLDDGAAVPVGVGS